MGMKRYQYFIALFLWMLTIEFIKSILIHIIMRYTLLSTINILFMLFMYWIYIINIVLIGIIVSAFFE